MEFTGFIIIFFLNKQLTLSTEFATGDRTNERAPTNWTLKLNWCHWLRWTPADRKHQNGSDWHPKLVLEQRTKVTTWATAEVENWSVYQLTCDWCTLGAGHLVKGGRWINQPETTQKGKPQSNSTPRNGRKIFFFFLIFFWYFFFLGSFGRTWRISANGFWNWAQHLERSNDWMGDGAVIQSRIWEIHENGSKMVKNPWNCPKSSQKPPKESVEMSEMSQKILEIPRDPWKCL